MAETPYLREPGYAQRYSERRFRSGTGARTDARERAAITRLLAATTWPDGRWLDVPCGAGRLSALLPGPVVQVDRDPAMVAACGAGHERLCASVHRLPFADGTFAGALCHRLLQHIPTGVERRDILRELGRVTRGPIVVSFFDACSLQHLRRVVRRRCGKVRSGRGAVGRGTFFGELHAAGLELRAVVALRRFVAEQTLVLCVPRAGGR